jgi:hypothetical protein
MVTREISMKVGGYRSLLAGFCFCVVVVLGVTTSTWAEEVHKGDKVAVDVTCRLPGGRTLLTTKEAVAQDPETAKARVFFGLNDYEPLEIFAGSGYGGPSWDYLVPLQSEVGARISEKITGMKVDETRTVRISTRRLQGLEPDQGYVSLARKVVEPKVQKVSPEALKKQFGRVPTKGEILQLNEQIALSVESTEKSGENEVVTVRMHIQDGATVETDFGTATLSNKNDEYYLKQFSPEEGDLVGVGPFLAYISEVHGETFVLDYRHPFGDRELTCDVCVRSVKKEGVRRNDNDSSKRSGSDEGARLFPIGNPGHSTVFSQE